MQTLWQKLLGFPKSHSSSSSFSVSNNSIYSLNFCVCCFSTFLSFFLYHLIFFFLHSISLTLSVFVYGLLTLWNTTSKSSSFPCKSPQMVTCLDIAVLAWFKFGKRFSRIVASFRMPATYFACRRLYCIGGAWAEREGTGYERRWTFDLNVFPHRIPMSQRIQCRKFSTCRRDSVS